MGMLVPFMGEFTVGDTLSTLVLAIDDRTTGLPVNLTGKTVSLVGRAKAGGEVLAIAGALSATPTDGTVTITAPTTGVVLGAKRSDKIEAQIKIALAADVMYSARFCYGAMVPADSTV
jgi:hypothetical protein